MLKSPFGKLQLSLRLLFVLAMEQTLLRMFLNIWRHILFPGDLHMMSLFKPGLHIVVMVVSTIANMFLTLFQAIFYLFIYFSLYL